MLGGAIFIVKTDPYPWDLLGNWFGHIAGDDDTQPVAAQQYSLISTILLTNIPQLALSTIYLLFNSLFTCMQVSAEFMRYAKQRKGLRVSKPKGNQRETYFLSLPYKFSIPLAIASMLLHWFLSQSLYFVELKGYNIDQSRNYELDQHGIAYNALPLIIELVIGGILIFVLIGHGFRKYDSSVPLVCSNSMAISAACHPIGVDGEHISTQKLQYGVMSKPLSSGLHRVAFSSDEVTPLIQGHDYE